MLGCTFSILLQKEGVNDICDVLILQEFPNSITCQHYYLVFWRQSEILDLWNSIDSNSACHSISKGPWHGKAWNIFVLKPDAHGTDLVSELVPIWINPTIVCNYMLRLFWVIGLMITTQCLNRASSWGCRCGSNQDSPWITYISTVNFAAVSYHAGTGRSTKSHIWNHLVDFSISVCKSLCQVVVDHLWIRVLSHTMILEAFFEILFDLKWQSVFH